MEQKSCKNCRYLSWHYIKLRNGTFQRLELHGHCLAGKLTWSQSDKIVKRCLRTDDCEGCEFWEPVEIKIEQRRECIKNTLRNMESALQEIAFTLEDDKEIVRQANICESIDV